MSYHFKIACWILLQVCKIHLEAVQDLLVVLHQKRERDTMAGRMSSSFVSVRVKFHAELSQCTFHASLPRSTAPHQRIGLNQKGASFLALCRSTLHLAVSVKLLKALPVGVTDNICEMLPTCQCHLRFGTKGTSSTKACAMDKPLAKVSRSGPAYHVARSRTQNHHLGLHFETDKPRPQNLSCLYWRRKHHMEALSFTGVACDPHDWVFTRHHERA